MLKAFALAALITSPTAIGPATGAPPQCLTRAEIRDLTLAALPIGLDAAAEACRASLPANAFLFTGGHALSERLQTGSDAHWAGAFAALAKVADTKDVPKGLKPETLRLLAHDMAASELKKAMKPADCGFANDLAETLAPLSEDGIARLVVAGIMIANHAQKPGGKKSVPAICPGPAQ
jgi:hypothetical protein